MDIKAEYKKLGSVQKRDIDEHVQDAINGLEGMRGDNDEGAAPIYVRLRRILADLIELQDAGGSAN